MRINKYVAQATGLSRRAADEAIGHNRVRVNGQLPTPGYDVTDSDQVTLDDRRITPAVNTITIMLNKPRGYVCSRNGQGSQTVYELLPLKYGSLKTVGRLDKDSSGLLLLTNDGQLAQELTHPSHQKTKVYEVTLFKALEPLHQQMLSDHGIALEDGVSKLQLERLNDERTAWRVTMSEGRNRQIRRTFEAVGYTVDTLHRTNFGTYAIGQLASGKFTEI